MKKKLKKKKIDKSEEWDDLLFQLGLLQRKLRQLKVKFETLRRGATYL